MNALHRLFMEIIKSEALGVSFNENYRISISDEQVKELYKLSRAHDLCHVVGNGLIQNNFISADSIAYDKFNEQVFKAVSKYERINHELEKISDALEDAKIPFIPLKGSVIRPYYAQCWLRSSCDIDIFVDKNDIEKAIETLVSKHGFRAEGIYINEKSVYSPSNVHVEIHFLEDESNTTEMFVLKNVWENCTNVDGKQYHKVMSWEYFYLYHIAHMAKHFSAGGCGVRSFLDLVVMNDKLCVDKDKLDALLKENNLYEFYDGCQKLIDVWFFGKEHDDLTKRMEDYILKAGVYGDKENWVAIQQGKNGDGTIKHLFKRLFPPYSDMILIYPKLEGKKILLPFYYVRKWFRLFKPGVAKRSMKEMKITATMTDKKREEVMNLFKNLGLDE